jgi:hypothetical protein
VLGPPGRALGASGSLPVDVAIALEAAAIMLTVERDRIVRRFHFVPLRGGGA